MYVVSSTLHIYLLTQRNFFFFYKYYEFFFSNILLRIYTLQITHEYTIHTWNYFDTACRCMTILVEQALPFDLRILRSFRCLRPLKMVSKVPSKFKSSGSLKRQCASLLLWVPVELGYWFETDFLVTRFKVMSLFISADEWSNNNLKVHTDTYWQIHNVQTFVFWEEGCQVVLT